MVDSRRETLIQNIITQLETISVANGYETNIGANVFEWRETPLQESELNCITVRDTNNSTEIAIQKHEHTLNLDVEIFAKNSTPQLMRKAIADVVKCIGVEAKKATPFTVAQSVKPVSDEVIENDQEKVSFSGILLKFEIEYVTDPWDPYNDNN